MQRKMVLINLFPVSAGGGLQNSLSFIRMLSYAKDVPFDYIISCRSGSIVHQYAIDLGLPHVAFAAGRGGRLFYELWRGAYFAKSMGAVCVFTLFGNPPLTMGVRVKKISGFAYSNIIQKEINFWGWLPLGQRIVKHLIDFLRLFLARRSDVIILETDYLLTRAATGVFSGKDLRVVKMAPSSLVVASLSSFGSDKSVMEREAGSVIRILYLSGAHPNKRIHFLAPLFLELFKLGLECRLITTLPEGQYLSLVRNEFEKLGIQDLHENIGPVAPENVANILYSSDAVINVAKLESFSNNWVEAWAAGLPLLVTDAQWARASCGNAAIYVDIDAPVSSAQNIYSILSSDAAVRVLVAEGRRVLSSLPTAEQRTHQYIEIIKSVLDNEAS